MSSRCLSSQIEPGLENTPLVNVRCYSELISTLPLILWLVRINQTRKANTARKMADTLDSNGGA